MGERKTSWTIVPYGDGDSLVIHAGDTADRICFMAVPTSPSAVERVEANARLIAAAPELAEALEMLIADFADYPASERPCLAFDKARAALAKAIGEDRS